jgi:hypothetical protein
VHKYCCFLSKDYFFAHKTAVMCSKIVVSYIQIVVFCAQRLLFGAHYYFGTRTIDLCNYCFVYKTVALCTSTVVLCMHKDFGT